MMTVMLLSVSALSGLFVATVTAVGLLQEAPAKPMRDAEGMTPEELKADIERRHPADYYRLAGMLFAKNRKNEAAFYFHLGQLDQIRAERTKKGLENRTDEPPISQCRPPRASARP
jgi:hypothetical protein